MIIGTSSKIVSCYSLCLKDLNFYKAPILFFFAVKHLAFTNLTETLDVSLVEGADSKEESSFLLS